MLFIRADANESIGTGHVMRCLSIAKAVCDAGEQVLFVTADHRGDILIKQAGFSSFCLNSDWMDMESELSVLTDSLRHHKPKLMLVDSYYVTEHYFQELKGLVKLAYIDDMNSACWNVDYLVNYNIFATCFDYSWYEKKKITLLLGPRYSPLREEFKHLPCHLINNNVEDILVSAGGADPEHITEKILQGICADDRFKTMRFHFIVGALNPRLDHIHSLAVEMDNVILHVNERHMSDLMQKCDLAISAAGTTLYELCACGIPTIVFTLADNQIKASEQFADLGIMRKMEDCRNNETFIDELKKSLSELDSDWKQRKTFSRRMQSIVDGCGSQRIVQEIT